MLSQLLLAFGLAAYTLASCLPGSPHLEKRDTSAADFSYTGTTGPLGWAGLSPDFAICRTGKNQSPINLDGAIALTRVSSVSYPYVQSARAKNTGKTIEIDARGFSPRGTLSIDGKTYLLENIHVHTPSEHRLFEEHFPLEVHLVHRINTGGNELAVVGIFYELVKPGLLGGILQSVNVIIKGITQAIGQITQPNSDGSTGSLDLRGVANYIRETPLHTYAGSLTTPPCSEGVKWLVANRPVDFDIDDYNAIKNIVKFNSRYTQNAPGQTNLLQLACI